jgi:hypothetical protein
MRRQSLSTLQITNMLGREEQRFVDINAMALNAAISAPDPAVSLCGFAPAEARGAHRHLRSGQRQIETRLDQRRFNRVAPAR